MWGISVDYIIQWVSPALAHFVGYEVDDVLGRDFREFVYADDMARVTASVKNQFATCFLPRVKTPSGYRAVKIITTWANHNGHQARFTQMVPV